MLGAVVLPSANQHDILSEPGSAIAGWPEQRSGPQIYATAFDSTGCEAFAIGEKSPLAGRLQNDVCPPGRRRVVAVAEVLSERLHASVRVVALYVSPVRVHDERRAEVGEDVRVAARCGWECWQHQFAPPALHEDLAWSRLWRRARVSRPNPPANNKEHDRSNNEPDRLESPLSCGAGVPTT